MSITEEIIDIPAEHIRNVFGEFDHYIKNIERALNVTIIARGGSLKVGLCTVRSGIHVSC